MVLTDRLFALTMKEVATAMLPGADDAVVGEVSLIIISWIGIDTKVIELNHVSADIELEDGQSQTTSQAIAKSAIKSKLAEARKVVSRDFRSAYDESVKQPIDAINERLSKLVVSGKPVSVTPRVQSSVEEDLHSILSKIDNKYDQSYRNAEDAKKMPTMSIWMKKHALILPYSISIQKCNDVSCCGELRSPVAFRNLVMQRQPIPQGWIRQTLNEKNHFLSRDDALRLFANNTSAVSDLTDLPSKKVDELKEAQKMKATRDKEVAQKLDLRSWDPKKVRSVVRCFHCNKPRCIFSKEMNTVYYQVSKLLKQRIKSISGYSCGDLLFDDDDEISNVIAQRQQLTCESRVEV